MRLCMSEAFEIMLPNTFFFQTPEESLDESVLLWCIRRDELLGQPICTACLSEPLTLEYKPIVTSDYRCLSLRTKGAVSSYTGFFESPFSFLGTSTQRELIPHYLPIVTINHRCKMSPPVIAATDMADIHGPPCVALTRSTSTLHHTRPGCLDTMIHKPSLKLHNPINRFAVYRYSFSEP